MWKRIKPDRKKKVKEDEIAKKKNQCCKLSQIKKITIKRIEIKIEIWKKFKDDEVENNFQFKQFYKKNCNKKAGMIFLRGSA
jgi:hypothetical protein